MSCIIPNFNTSIKVSKVIKYIPLSKEICKAVKWWEKETGIKFNGKIINKNGTIGYRWGTINTTCCSVDILFHELQHYTQAKTNKFFSTQIYNNWYKVHREKRNDNFISYFHLPTEKDANRKSWELYLKFQKRQCYR